MENTNTSMPDEYKPHLGRDILFYLYTAFFQIIVIIYAINTPQFTTSIMIAALVIGSIIMIPVITNYCETTDNLESLPWVLVIQLFWPWTVPFLWILHHFSKKNNPPHSC